MKNNAIWSWKTSKISNGYLYTVSKITPRKTINKMGQFADTKIVKRGVLPTRARAKSTAIKIIRSLKN